MVYVTLYGRDISGAYLGSIVCSRRMDRKKNCHYNRVIFLILVFKGGEIKNIIDRDRPELTDDDAYVLEEESKIISNQDMH